MDKESANKKNEEKRKGERKRKRKRRREREVTLVSFPELKLYKEQGQNCTPAAMQNFK